MLYLFCVFTAIVYTRNRVSGGIRERLTCPAWLGGTGQQWEMDLPAEQLHVLSSKSSLQYPGAESIGEN